MALSKSLRDTYTYTLQTSTTGSLSKLGVGGPCTNNIFTNENGELPGLYHIGS
jgi:hypothetical protein